VVGVPGLAAQTNELDAVDIDAGDLQRVLQVADDAARAVGDDDLLAFEVLGGADLGAGDHAVVPVILGLRDVDHALVTTGAVDVRLVVQAADELVAALQQERRALAHADGRLVAAGEAADVHDQLEAVLLGDAGVAPHRVQRHVRDVARDHADLRLNHWADSLASAEC
jgi:hypothetical protein